MKNKVVRKIMAITLMFTFLFGLLEPAQRNESALVAKQKGKDVNEVSEKEKSFEVDAKGSNFLIRKSADELFKASFSTEEMHYKDGKEWKAIDPFFVTSKNKDGYENRQGNRKLEVPSYLGDNPISAENNDVKIKMFPLGMEGDILRTDATHTTAVKESIKGLTEHSKNMTTGIQYQSQDDVDYRIQSLHNGFSSIVELKNEVKDSNLLSYRVQMENATIELHDIKEEVAINEENDSENKDVINDSNDEEVNTDSMQKGRELRLVNPDSKIVGSLSKIAISNSEGEISTEAYYTVELVESKKKGKSTFYSYVIRIHVEDSLIDNKKPITIEKKFSWGKPKKETEGFYFENVKDILKDRVIESATLNYSEKSENEESKVIVNGSEDSKEISLKEYVIGVKNGTYEKVGFTVAGTNNPEEENPILEVTYSPELSAPYATLNKIYINEKEDTSVTWWGLDHPEQSKVEYQIVELEGCEGKEKKEIVVPYSEKTKLGEEGEGNQTLPTSSLKQGCYVVLVRAQDSQGNTSVENKSHLHIDHTKPKLANISISPKTNKNKPFNGSPTLAWSGAKDEHLDRVEYWIDKGSGSSKEQYTIAGKTAEGKVSIGAAEFSSQTVNTIKIRSVDKSGNTSVVKSIDFYYDNEIPEIKNVKITKENSKDHYATEPATITYDIEDAYLEKITVTVDDGEEKVVHNNGNSVKGTYQIPASKFTATNLYIITVKATDQAGNVNLRSEPFYYAETPDCIQDYKPEDLKCVEQVDGKKELIWTKKNDAENVIQYEIHKSETKNFIPNQSSLVVENVTDNSYMIPEDQEEGTYYYQVRAVTNTPMGDSMVMASDYSAVAVAPMSAPYADIVSTNRMGKKPYLPYLDFSTGNASGGSIEQTKGNVFYQMQAIHVPSQDLSISIAPVYNSQSSVDYGMGVGWMPPYQTRIQMLSNSECWYQEETGAQYVTKRNADGVYKTEENPDFSIISESKLLGDRRVSSFTLKNKDHHTYYYDSYGYLIEISEPKGDYLRFQYNSDYDLTMIKSSTGKSVSFFYSQSVQTGGEYKLVSSLLPDTTGCKKPNRENQPIISEILSQK